MFRHIPCWAAIALAFGIGLVYALALLGLGFVTPGSRYWVLPEGYSGGLVDSRLVLSGYYWLVQDAWRWPLMHIVQPNGAAGANAALMDVVPALALLFKALRGWIGAANPYGIWVVGCFALNAAALAALIRGLGQRSLAAAGAAGALGALMPLVHLRFGHYGLCAQWSFVFPLAAYAAHARGTLSTRIAAAVVIAMSLLAFTLTIYLYVMAAAIAAAFLVQAALDRRMSVLQAGLGLVLVLAAGGVPFWAFGLAGGQSIAAETVPFGYASMNLVSPFWPQSSGLFAGTGVYSLTRGLIGATPGQYEGYAYLGGGTLLLLAAVLARPRAALHWLGGTLRRHFILAAALAVLTLWAVSNQVYLGDRLVLSYPVPEVLLRTVLAWFRASGRFFWPVAWLLSAVALAGVLTLYRPRTAAALLALALALQWFDLGLWRARLAALTHKPPISAFGSLDASATVEAEIAGLGQARVIPALACSARPGDYVAVSTVAGIELQLLAARQGARMSSITLARTGIDCVAERATTVRGLAGNGLALVLVQPGDRDRRDEARQDLSCHETNAGLVCVPRLRASPPGRTRSTPPAD